MKNSFAEFFPITRADLKESIVDRFERQVKHFPDRLAVKYESSYLTYSDLNRSANRLARTIIAKRQYKPEPVAILLGWSCDLAIAILGILKANKFYVPIDIAIFSERSRMILQDTDAPLIVTTYQYLDLAGTLAGGELAGGKREIILLDALEDNIDDENLMVYPSPDDLAYILYTSGSTGKPKGVMQSHENVLYYMKNYTNSIAVDPGDRFSLLSSFSTGASVSAIFGALLNGAALFPFDLREKGLIELIYWLREEKITVYHSVPTLFRSWVQLLDREVLPDLRWLKLGGETITIRDVEIYRKFFSEKCNLYIGLGATEMNTIAKYIIDRRTSLGENIVPVGYPPEDTGIMIVDEEGRAVSEGEVGEIFIKSAYLFRGYWQASELTETVLSSSQDERSQYLYRTGDLGRLRADGCLEYWGRKDSQVKISGNRIEVSEIELALLEIQHIKEAVVVGKTSEEGEQFLVAYLVTDNNFNLSNEEIRKFLQAKLPPYMIPAQFTFLNDLPKTSNGKIDRKALQSLPQLKEQLNVEAIVNNKQESKLQNIFQKVLNTPHINTGENLIDLGINSLQILLLIAQIEKEFAKKISPGIIYQSKTIEQLSEVIHSCRPNLLETSLVPIKPQGNKPPFFFVNSISYCQTLGNYFKPEQPFYGLNIFGITNFLYNKKPDFSIEDIATKFVEDIYSIQDKGPYFLGTYCADYILTFEIAKKLRELGHEIALLVCIDSIWNPAKSNNISLKLYNFKKFGLTYIFNKIHGKFISEKEKLAIFLNHPDRKTLRNKTNICLQQDISILEKFKAVRKSHPVQKYNGKVTLLLSSEWHSKYSEELARLLVEEIETRAIPGYHHTLFEKPYIQILANQLNASIEEVKKSASLARNPTTCGNNAD